MTIVLVLFLLLVAGLIKASGPPPATGAMTIQFVPVEPPQLPGNVATWLLALVAVLFILAMAAA